MTRCKYCLLQGIERAGNWPRGLCRDCFRAPAIRDAYPIEERTDITDRYEPTEEQIERTIAEQSQELPPWWERDRAEQNEPAAVEIRCYRLREGEMREIAP